MLNFSISPASEFHYPTPASTPSLAPSRSAPSPVSRTLSAESPASYGPEANSSFSNTDSHRISASVAGKNEPNLSSSGLSKDATSLDTFLRLSSRVDFASNNSKQATSPNFPNP